MNKAPPYLEDFLKTFKEDHPNAPKIDVKCRTQGRGEGFHTTYAGGAVTLVADSPLAALFGASQLSVGFASGHWTEMLGPQSPKFSLRPLWITLPTTDDFEKVCRELLFLGYNAILLEFSQTELLEKEGAAQTVHSLAVFHEFGIKVILKPKFEYPQGRSLLDPDCKEAVQKFLGELQQLSSHVDYLFWEGAFQRKDFNFHPDARDFLQSDLALIELRMLEDCLPSSQYLIYYLPCLDLQSARHQAEWLPAFCDDVGNHTLLAFSAVGGDPVLDHLYPHPLWEKLRLRVDISYTPLLPIVNIGAVKQGDGLWPILTFDLMERYFLRCQRHHFAGVLSLTPHLPKPESLLGCNLWVASQMLWGRGSAELLAQTWFNAFRPDIDYGKCAASLKEVRQLSIEMRYLHSLANEESRDEISAEECRAMAESLLARLNQLEFYVKKNATTKEQENRRPSISDYVTFFVRDVRRILFHCLQFFHISLADVLNGEEMLESFWTRISQTNSQGAFSRAQVTFLKEPQKGKKGTVMRKIYEEIKGK